MPREQMEWFKKEAIHDSAKLRAKQCCTYYSIVNVNKGNYPFLSSYEQEQTWTLTRTISNHHKRYQSSIENIHLTRPMAGAKTKHVDYENVQIKKNRSNSLLPPIPLAHKYTPSTALHPSSSEINSAGQTEAKVLSIKPILNQTSDLKNDTIVKKPRALIKPMRVIHSNGEFVVRI